MAWDGDADGAAVRLYLPGVRTAFPLASELGEIHAIATCTEGTNSVVASDATYVGDHLIVLKETTLGPALQLISQYGQSLGEKLLVGTEQRIGTGGSTPNGYFPFGRHAVSLVVGDLVSDAGQTYREEVVVSTRDGSLLWLSIDDMLDTSAGAFLPAAGPGQEYFVEVLHDHPSPPADTQVQPHTNRNLSSAWALSRRAGDNDLHVLDQSGAYWQVAYDGTASLWERDRKSLNARGWSDLGNRVGTQAVGLASPSFASDDVVEVRNLILHGVASEVLTHPWRPEVALEAFYENAPAGHPYLADNWVHGDSELSVFEGFAVHKWGGVILETTNPNPGNPPLRLVWYWSDPTALTAGDPWGNMVEGVKFLPSGGASPWLVTGLWGSTEGKPSGTTGRQDWLEYHDLRTFELNPSFQTIQSLEAVDVAGQTTLFLACTGGRLRVLQPGTMRPDDMSVHGMGNLVASSADLGCGSGALAVRKESNGTVTIWMGTIFDHVDQPGSITNGSGVLADNEVAAGGVHRMSWNGSQLTAVQQHRHFTPGTAPAVRGGQGVIGLYVADLIDDANGHDELIVGTLSGDIYVLDAEDLSVVHWSTHVTGSAGAFNSMRVEDLNGGGRPELYVSGSFGIWRFVSPDEGTPTEGGV